MGKDIAVEGSADFAAPEIILDDLTNSETGVNLQERMIQAIADCPEDRIKKADAMYSAFFDNAIELAKLVKANPILEPQAKSSSQIGPLFLEVSANVRNVTSNNVLTAGIQVAADKFGLPKGMAFIVDRVISDVEPDGLTFNQRNSTVAGMAPGESPHNGNRATAAWYEANYGGILTSDETNRLWITVLTMECIEGSLRKFQNRTGNRQTPNTSYGNRIPPSKVAQAMVESAKASKVIDSI